MQHLRGQLVKLFLRGNQWLHHAQNFTHNEVREVRNYGKVLNLRPAFAQQGITAELAEVNPRRRTLLNDGAGLTSNLHRLVFLHFVYRNVENVLRGDVQEAPDFASRTKLMDINVAEFIVVFFLRIFTRTSIINALRMSKRTGTAKVFIGIDFAKAFIGLSFTESIFDFGISPRLYGEDFWPVFSIIALGVRRQHNAARVVGLDFNATKRVNLVAHSDHESTTISDNPVEEDVTTRTAVVAVLVENVTHEGRQLASDLLRTTTGALKKELAVHRRKLAVDRANHRQDAVDGQSWTTTLIQLCFISLFPLLANEEFQASVSRC